MVVPVYAVAIDWDADGNFADTGDDVTSRTLLRDGISVGYGRDSARALSPLASGQGAFTLNNESRDYSPLNSSSPLFANLGPGRPVRIQATHASTTYTLFYGQLDDYTVDPERGGRVAKISLVDGLARLRDVTISTPVYSGIRTGEAIDVILDEIGWTAGRDLDSGGTAIRFWWEDGADAWSAIEALVNSEGAPALVSIGADGSFVFRDRHHRLVRSVSTTSQTTIRDSGAEPRMSRLDYSIGWREIVNSVEVDVPVLVPARAAEVVWQSPSVITIDASSTEEIWAVSDDEPFINATAPESGADFDVLAGSVTSVSLSRDSGQSTVISLTAGGSGARVQGLQLQALPLRSTSTVHVSYEDAASVTRFGRRSGAVQAPWAGRYDAAAIARLVVQKRKDRVASADVTLRSGHTTRLTQQLDRDLSDRVTLIETQTGLNGAVHIERISHSADDGVLETTFGVEEVGTTLDDPSTVFLVGTSSIGTGVLGR